VEFKQPQAIYMQIADYISEKILRGDWMVDSKIPSIRELAVEIEVNPNTVAKAYDYLEVKHIIYTQRGIGYFVAKGADDIIIGQKKERFFQEDMPEFFKALQFLRIDINDFGKFYKEFARAQQYKEKL
jgi:GntR family transcriptional regulator